MVRNPPAHPPGKLVIPLNKQSKQRRSQKGEYVGGRKRKRAMYFQGKHSKSRPWRKRYAIYQVGKWIQRYNKLLCKRKICCNIILIAKVQIRILSMRLTITIGKMLMSIIRMKVR